MFTPVTLQQMPQNLYQLCQILQKASLILQQQYEMYCEGSSFDIQNKQDHSPVTQADLLVNIFLEQELAKLSQVYPIISEEGEHQLRKEWQEFWLIDPLDGTKEFIHKTGEFTINLSLIVDGESVISVLAVPLQQRIYISQKGELPYRWQWENDAIALYQYVKSQLRVDATQRIFNIAMSRRRNSPSHSVYDLFLKGLEEQQLSYQTVSAGSAYKFCMMLEGEIDLYPRLHPTCEWDTAAGQGLLESIGGGLVTLDAKSFTYNQREQLENGSFIALADMKDWEIVQKINLEQSYPS